jgi:hypothetical protein
MPVAFVAPGPPDCSVGAARSGIQDAGLVIDKTLADRLAHPLHESGLTRDARLGQGGARGLSGMAMIA